VSDPLELTGAQAAAAIRAGDLDARELFEAYRARAAAEELNAFTWVGDEAPATDPDAPLAADTLLHGKFLVLRKGKRSIAGAELVG